MQIFANLIRRLGLGGSASDGVAVTPAAAGPAFTPTHRGQGLDVYRGDFDEADEFAITRYPPFDEGIPLLPTEKIVRSQQDLIERIFRTAGVSRSEFERLYLRPIENLARHVHLLPATSKTYFRGTGGLFRMSVDVALNSLQSANASVFPTGGGVERRFAMQPRWTLATFLAGLCSQNYRTVNMMAVMTRDNQQWTPLLDHLFDWCRRANADRYFVRWVDELHMNGAQASAAYSISQVVPAEVLQFLAADNNQVVPAMTAAIAGVETNISENPIGRLVAPVITRVIEEDCIRSANNYGHLVIGAHLETHLVDAMRRLVKNGKWIANNVTSGGRVWVGKEGVFLDWPTASADISNLLTRDSFAGVPQDPDTLADLLVSAKLLQNNTRGGRYWTITLPTTFEVREGVVKLLEGHIIFPQGFDFSPYQSVTLTLEQGNLNAPKADDRNPAGQDRPVIAGSQNRDAKRDPVRDHRPVVPTDAGPAPATRLSEKSDGEGAREKTKPAPAAPVAASTSEPEPHIAPPETGGQKKKRRAPLAPTETAPGPAIEAPTSAPEESSTPDSLVLDQELGESASKLLRSLKHANGWLLNEILRKYRQDGLEGKVIALPYGLGITHEELNSYGMPIVDFMEELFLKGWLWQDRTRANRRLHSVEIDGKTLRLVILKPEIAGGLGFDTRVKE